MSEGTYRAERWSLERLLPDREAETVERALAGLDQAAGAVEALRPRLSAAMSREEFEEVLAALRVFAERAARISGFAGLAFSEDTQDQAALALMGRLEQALSELQNRVLFFELWWRGLDEESASRLVEGEGDDRYYLEKQRLFRPHTLSEPEEKLVTIKDVNGANALNTLYDMMTNRFSFELEVEGERKKLTRDALTVYFRHPDAAVRERAYRELFRLYGADAPILGQIYLYRLRDWASENVKLRGFSSPLAVRNLSNDVPDTVVDTLLDVCAEGAQVFHRYFKLKARWLGVEKLSRFDVYAPLRDVPEKDIPYGEAVQLVLESLGRFSPELAALARRVFDERRVDAEVRPGKRGGAFCYSVLPALTPWVLLNYTGEPRQVATLAHELGHAVHSMMASHHSVLTFHSALPLAETASVFSEMLLTDRLLERERDPEVRRSLLAGMVDDAYATVLRQAFFVLFERDAHHLAVSGGTTDNLSSLYLENLFLQFADAVDVDELFRHEWVSIPHIYHAPFYCYAYSFGQLLSLSLYQRYKDEGDAFAPALLKILAAGGSRAPQDILGDAGIRMADPEFWRSGFRAIEAMVDELEQDTPGGEQATGAIR